MSISRTVISPSAVPHPPIHWRLLAWSVAEAAVQGTLSLARATGRRMAEWQAGHRLAGHDDAFLKDIGVPRCGVEHAVRHGRADRRSKR